MVNRFERALLHKYSRALVVCAAASIRGFSAENITSDCVLPEEQWKGAHSFHVQGNPDKSFLDYSVSILVTS